MRRAVAGIVVAAGLVLAVAACDSTATIPTTPSTTPTLITENFSGDLVLGTTNLHTFAANKGVAIGTLTTLSPLATAHIGMSLGVWDGTNCTVVATNDAMAVGSTVVGTATIDNVNLCLRVYDVGNVPPDTTYTYAATVTHY